MWLVDYLVVSTMVMTFCLSAQQRGASPMGALRASQRGGVLAPKISHFLAVGRFPRLPS